MTVRMTHPNLPGQPKDDVAESAVDILRQSGWQTDDDVARAKAAQDPPDKAATPSPAPRSARADTSSKE